MAKVLIVDDAAFMRMMLKNILEKSGHEVVGEAEDVPTGIELFLAKRPDLVTMDITMPKVSGIEGVKQIMEIDPAANVIMVSAMGQQAMVLDAVKSGAKDFIVKPFQQDRIVQAIDKVLQRAKLT